MDVLHDSSTKPKIITGNFMCTQQKPVTTSTSNTTNYKGTAVTEKNDVAKIPSRCQLDCDSGLLSLYELTKKTPFIMLPKGWKMTRNKHDRNYFCLEYGSEAARFTFFLIICNKREADEWEFEMCKITGQMPPIRRRTHTDAGKFRSTRPTRYVLSTPSTPEGFSETASVEGSSDTPTDDSIPEDTDSTDGAEAGEDGTKPGDQGQIEKRTYTDPEARVCKETDGPDKECGRALTDATVPKATNSTDGAEADGTKSDEQVQIKKCLYIEPEARLCRDERSCSDASTDTIPKAADAEKVEDAKAADTEQLVVDNPNIKPVAAIRRDGQKDPEESHLGVVIGFDKVSPSPGNTPNLRLSDEVIPDNTVMVGDRLVDVVKQLEDIGQQHHDADDKISSGNQLLISRAEPLRSDIRQAATSKCTHIEIECSQEKLKVTVNKEDFLNTDNEINDIFIFYKGFLYLKSCPERLRDKLFIGTRVLQVNNQEPLSEDRAIDHILTSALETVDLLIQLFPLGVRVRLHVPSFEDLGIRLHSNEIMSMTRDGVMNAIVDGLKCVYPALTHRDVPTLDNLSITAIGRHHIPHDAMTKDVEAMLQSAIDTDNGGLVMQLHPSEFCHAMGGAVLNLRSSRKPSLARIEFKD